MWVILITVGHLGLSLTYRHDPFPTYEACVAFVESEAFRDKLDDLSVALDKADGAFTCVPEHMRLELDGEDS